MTRNSLLGCALALTGILLGAPASAQNESYFKLHTMFQEAANKCLNGNVVGPNSTANGGSFMDDCRNAHNLDGWERIVEPGLDWQAVSEANGYFRLKTRALSKGKCLEGNRVAQDAMLQGAAFMDDCQNVSGQLWKAVPESNGYFRLKTMFQGEQKCLEGNRLAPDAALRGAAFMNDCQNASGQLWKLLGGNLVNGIPQAGSN
ncbi:hypothetical protein [Aquamicrobium sp.]|uniref:RICIN domain-containing protein n=1 Tax=Aquamicrobium sp. TaxID=1872579 RepID=UPI0025868762|nr:hypothetical protein [Aquamicrobium sp.]MCK9554089.1 RICIN domain-containing protein [Aquamicrobium sp.]